MRALLVGLGSIGRRHLANLKSLGVTSHITILRRPGYTETEPDCEVVSDLSDVVKSPPDFAILANPAAHHIEVALALARAGSHLFIEKPISHTVKGIDELLSISRDQSVVLMVGYNFRFYKPLQIVKRSIEDGLIGRPLSFRAEVGQFLPHWRYNVDYKKTASARADMGGGAVLELSHELDFARWLMGEPQTVFARTDRLSDLVLDVEDSSEVIMTFAGGATGNIHLDMIDRASTRNFRIIGTEGTITWDGLTHQVRLWSASDNDWQDLHPATEIDRNEMYVEELRHFLACVKKRETPIVTGEDGKRVVEIVEAIKRSSIEQRVISL